MFLFQDRFSANAYAAEAAYQNLEDYRISLTRKYPAHASTIKKLLDEYQSWVITLEEKYGLPPILAMKNAKEAEFSILFRDPDLFMKIYEHIPRKVGNDEKRANCALLLSKEPDRLAAFLELIQEMDHRSIPTFINYPNAGAFLLTTGLEGYDLLKEHGEEVLFLSLFLNEADQKRLPELFHRYPELGLIVEETGMEGFLIFLSVPEFYHRFLSNFYQDRRFGCVLGCEYIKTVSEHLGRERFQKIAGGPDRDYLAGALGEIAKSHNEDGTPGYNSLISDPYITEFLVDFRRRSDKAVFRFRGSERIRKRTGTLKRLKRHFAFSIFCIEIKNGQGVLTKYSGVTNA